MWRKISSKVVLDHPRLKLAEDTVVLPDGKQINYLVIEDHPDCPTIIARREDGKILLIKEHAYPINESLWQFPEGASDAGEDIDIAAARELGEETGYGARKVVRIGTNLHWHRRNTSRGIIYLAEDIYKLEVALKFDAEEQGITVHWLSEAEIWKMISDGDIIQKNTLAAWSTYQAYLLN